MARPPNEEFADSDLELLLDGKAPAPSEIEWLCRMTLAHPVDRELVKADPQSLELHIAERLEDYKRVRDPITQLGQSLGFRVTTKDLWSCLLPLARLVVRWDHAGARSLIGMVGPPGAGKTTLCEILACLSGLISDQTTAGLSLDDFYLSPAERKAKGHKWRAAPGTHDIELLNTFLNQIKTSDEPIALPRYDTRSESRLDPVIYESNLRLVIFEGWFVGATAPGYELLARSLDGLIYLDLDFSLAFEARIKREEKIRAESGGEKGLSEDEALEFWRDVLGPGIETLVIPLRERAQVVLTLDSRHSIRAAYCRPQASGASTSEMRVIDSPDQQA